ncbi:MAG TPA: ZIP family metal transporter [Steroidobacteraceae bacterium]|nr:ZIP family metal transporter [Steroidobacteraceae bacterium]
MKTLLWIVLATTLAGLLSAALASLFLLLPERRRTHLLPHLISFATGAMLAAALLGLLPEAIASVGPSRIQAIGASVLGGIALFFVLEKLVLWRHCHVEDCESHGTPATQPGHGHAGRDPGHGHAHVQVVSAMPAAQVSEAARDKAAGYIVVFGDGVHNAFDGVLIAAAFLTDTRLGVVTTLAIAAHEVPQELGDLAVLLHSGMSPLRAMFFNVASSMTSVIGGVLGCLALERTLDVLPYAISVAAASLIYVAVADLIPGLHRRVDPFGSVMQVVLIGAGVALIGVMEMALG